MSLVNRPDGRATDRVGNTDNSLSVREAQEVRRLVSGIAVADLAAPLVLTGPDNKLSGPPGLLWLEGLRGGGIIVQSMENISF